MDYLVPESFFEARSTLILLVLLAVGIAVVVKGANWLVDGAVGLSERLGVPKVIVGATVVSLGTTAPEAAVSVMAAFKGNPGLALGNSVGSIICDTGMIFGVCCLVTRLPLNRFVLNRQGWAQFGAGVLLVVVSLLFWESGGAIRVIPRFVGVMLVGLLAVYLLFSIRWARQHRDAQPMIRGKTQEELAAIEAAKPVIVGLGWLVLGIILVVMASHVLVHSVGELCERWGVAPSVVAATLVAFGTSLPELVTAITSIYRGHKELVVGNIVGADVLNVLFVTGAAACAAPLTVDSHFLRLDFPIMLATLIVFRVIIFCSKDTFPRWPGVIFLALYIFFLIGSYLR